MLEPTKKPLTDSVVMSFTVPAHLITTVMQTMHSLGLKEENESIPWREALPYDPNEWPGIALRGGRTKEGLTQKQLSELTGIPRSHISAMENNTRTIGKQNARKLAEALSIEARLLLGV